MSKEEGDDIEVEIENSEESDKEVPPVVSKAGHGRANTEDARRDPQSLNPGRRPNLPGQHQAGRESPTKP